MGRRGLGLGVVAALAVAWLTAMGPAEALGVEIWDLEAVDANGWGTHPDLATSNPVTFQGVVLNAPGDMLNPATQWQMYVQALPTAALANQGGIALYANAFYMPAINTWPRYSTVFQAGDVVEVTGLIAFYNGKTNLNERHNPTNVFTVKLLGAGALPDPWLIPSIADAVTFDQTRATGGERYQGQWCRLTGAEVASGTWAADQQLSITDVGGGTLGLKLGYAGTWGDAPGGKFNLTAIFDQEDVDADADGVYDEAYRLWPLAADQIERWGDVNLDGIVNVTDRSLVKGNLGLTGAAWADGDFDGDGEVTEADLAELNRNFVPEPATIGLLVAGGLAALARKRLAWRRRRGTGGWGLRSRLLPLLALIALAAVVGCTSGRTGKEEGMSVVREGAAGPQRFNWSGAEPYIPLLEGPPRTRGMRSGRVALQAGETCGEHTTGAHEEFIIVLEGRGQGLAKGRDPVALEAGQALYVPPHTVHNMKNVDAPMFKYIYVVAPIPGEAPAHEPHDH